MFSEIDETNYKLSEQILKLRRAKAEMEEVFTDLDNLLEDTSNFNNSYTTSSIKPKFNNSKRLNYTLDDTLDSTDDYASTIDTYDSVLEDDSDLEIHYQRHLRPKSKENKKPPKPTRSPASIKFSYKMPMNNYSAPRPYSNSFQPTLDDLMYRNEIFTDDSEVEMFMRRNRRPKSSSQNQPQKFNPKPAWTPNGKFQPPYKPTLSSSMSALNKSFGSTKSPNPSLSTPWRHTGKTKHGSALYLSSQDLSKSRESVKVEKNRPRIDPKDVGKGWRVTLGGSKSDLGVYAQPVEEKDPIKKVIVKRKIIVDKKDIGGGWKTTLGMPKPDYIPYSQPPVDKDPIKKVVVKRKVVVDEKDVGKGWKPTAFRAKEDLKIYEKPMPENTDPSSGVEEKEKKKKIVDEKDVGTGWKPVGKIKDDNYPKANLDSVKKSSDDQTTDDAGKPPLPKDNAKSKTNTQKKWLPSGQTKTTHPNTWTDDALLKTGAAIKPNFNIKKSSPPKPESKEASKSGKGNVMTSTPNMSKNFEEDPLEASIIEKSSPHVVDTPKIGEAKETPTVSEKVRDEDLNKKLGNDDDEENEVEDSPNKPEPKVDENNKKDENKEPEAEEKKIEPRNVELSEKGDKDKDLDDEKSVHDDDEEPEPKDFTIFRRVDSNMDDVKEATGKNVPPEEEAFEAKPETESPKQSEKDSKPENKQPINKASEPKEKNEDKDEEERSNNSVFRLVDGDEEFESKDNKKEAKPKEKIDKNVPEVKNSNAPDKKSETKPEAKPEAKSDDENDDQLWNLKDSDEE
jgi:hypothetical protein